MAVKTEMRILIPFYQRLFTGELGLAKLTLAGTRKSPFWMLLELRMTDDIGWYQYQHVQYSAVKTQILNIDCDGMTEKQTYGSQRERRTEKERERERERGRERERERERDVLSCSTPSRSYVSGWEVIVSKGVLLPATESHSDWLR